MSDTGRGQLSVGVDSNYLSNVKSENEILFDNITNCQAETYRKYNCIETLLQTNKNIEQNSNEKIISSKASLQNVFNDNCEYLAENETCPQTLTGNRKSEARKRRREKVHKMLNFSTHTSLASIPQCNIRQTKIGASENFNQKEIITLDVNSQMKQIDTAVKNESFFSDRRETNKTSRGKVPKVKRKTLKVNEKPSGLYKPKYYKHLKIDIDYNLVNCAFFLNKYLKQSAGKNINLAEILPRLPEVKKRSLKNKRPKEVRENVVVSAETKKFASQYKNNEHDSRKTDKALHTVTTEKYTTSKDFDLEKEKDSDRPEELQIPSTRLASSPNLSEEELLVSNELIINALYKTSEWLENIKDLSLNESEEALTPNSRDCAVDSPTQGIDLVEEEVMSPTDNPCFETESYSSRILTEFPNGVDDIESDNRMPDVSKNELYKDDTFLMDKSNLEELSKDTESVLSRNSTYVINNDFDYLEEIPNGSEFRKTLLQRKTFTSFDSEGSTAFSVSPLVSRENLQVNSESQNTLQTLFKMPSVRVCDSTQSSLQSIDDSLVVNLSNETTDNSVFNQFIYNKLKSSHSMIKKKSDVPENANKDLFFIPVNKNDIKLDFNDSSEASTMKEMEIQFSKTDPNINDNVRFPVETLSEIDSNACEETSNLDKIQHLSDRFSNINFQDQSPNKNIPKHQKNRNRYTSCDSIYYNTQNCEESNNFSCVDKFNMNFSPEVYYCSLANPMPNLVENNLPRLPDIDSYIKKTQVQTALEGAMDKLRNFDCFEDITYSTRKRKHSMKTLKNDWDLYSSVKSNNWKKSTNNSDYEKIDNRNRTIKNLYCEGDFSASEQSNEYSLGSTNSLMKLQSKISWMEYKFVESNSESDGDIPSENGSTESETSNGCFSFCKPISGMFFKDRRHFLT